MITLEEWRTLRLDWMSLERLLRRAVCVSVTSAERRSRAGTVVPRSQTGWRTFWVSVESNLSGE